MNIVITGVSKGIGLALTKKALEEGHKVYGVARKPMESKELLHLKETFSQLEFITLDLSDPEAALKLQNALKSCPAIDLLINNAGIYEKGTSKQEFLHSFEVNSYVPFMVTEALLDKLEKANQPKVIHITSMMGSIADNTSGGAYAYRASKSALNMIHKSLSVDYAWLTSAVIHPGWVQTNMGGSSAPTSPEQSANGIWNVIKGLGLKDSGTYKTFEGKSLPW